MTAPSVAPTLRCTNCGCPGAVVTTISMYVGGSGYQDREQIACASYQACIDAVNAVWARGQSIVAVQMEAERYNRALLATDRR